MTRPLDPPARKNPQERSVSPNRPPEMRSRAALGLTAAAAEGRFALQHCATAPKSNAAYVAQKASFKAAKETGSLMPPANILNAPTKLMKDIGYGEGYSYDHEAKDGFSGDNYWPEGMEPQTFYEPVERGFERKVKERIEYWNRLRAEKQT